MLTVGMQARQILSQLKIFVCNTEAKIARGKMDRLKYVIFRIGNHFTSSENVEE